MDGGQVRQRPPPGHLDLQISGVHAGDQLGEVEGGRGHEPREWSRRRTRGRIILVASTGGLHGDIGLSAYAASKGGLLAFGRSLAAEGAGQGVLTSLLALARGADRGSAGLHDEHAGPAHRQALLEKHMARSKDAAYADYVRRTSGFFPWPPHGARS